LSRGRIWDHEREDVTVEGKLENESKRTPLNPLVPPTENNGGKACKSRRWLPWAMVLGILFLWLVVPTARKMYYDAMVRDLCAKDGGVKVYETVALPADMFNSRGQINFFKPIKGEYALGPEYIFKEERVYFRNTHPAVWRTHYRIVRRSDLKTLSEAVIYTRRGGDPIAPWHDSSFSCPGTHEIPFIENTYVPLTTGETQ
jgi:hypothetical protein